MYVCIYTYITSYGTRPRFLHMRMYVCKYACLSLHIQKCHICISYMCVYTYIYTQKQNIGLTRMGSNGICYLSKVHTTPWEWLPEHKFWKYVPKYTHTYIQRERERERSWCQPLFLYTWAYFIHGRVTLLCTNIHTHAVHKNTHIHAYMHVGRYVYIYIYIYTLTHTFTHMCISPRICEHVYMNAEIHKYIPWCKSAVAEHLRLFYSP